MIVVDAGMLIALWDRSDAHFAVARAVFAQHAESNIHPVNLGEALVHAIRRGEEHAVRAKLTALGLREVETLTAQGFALARARAETGLKMPDCCALVCAEELGMPLATVDRRLAEVARRRGLRVLPAA